MATLSFVAAASGSAPLMAIGLAVAGGVAESRLISSVGAQQRLDDHCYNEYKNSAYESFYSLVEHTGYEEHTLEYLHHKCDDTCALQRFHDHFNKLSIMGRMRLGDLLAFSQDPHAHKNPLIGVQQQVSQRIKFAVQAAASNNLYYSGGLIEDDINDLLTMSKIAQQEFKRAARKADTNDEKLKRMLKQYIVPTIQKTIERNKRDTTQATNADPVNNRIRDNTKDNDNNRTIDDLLGAAIRSMDKLNLDQWSYNDILHNDALHNDTVHNDTLYQNWMKNLMTKMILIPHNTLLLVAQQRL